MPTYFLKTQFLLFVLTSFLLLNNGCKKNTTEPVETFALTVEDVSCTEAWIKITTTNYQTQNTLTLFVNDKANQSITLVSNDTLLYVDSLLPSQNYKIKATFANNNQLQTTNEVVAKTMDTISHNFSWQTFTFGEHSSSVLYDVAIIDENNIWAVGEIFMNDSLDKPDPIAYNAIHWDGSKWEVKKISVLFRGNYITPPLEGVCAFSSSDIWFVGSLPIHGDGNNWTMYDLRTTLNPNLSLAKAWGVNSSNIYFVGRAGSIAHYDGKNWQKIESGTTLNIGDIWGISDGKGGFNKYCVTKDALLKFNSENRLSIINAEAGMYLNLAWGISDRLIYTAGNGVVLYRNYKWENIDIPELNTVYGIKGQNYNDIYGISTTSSILHFNGYGWHSIKTLPNSVFYRLDVKNNLTVTCGWQGDKALITILKK
ncbi:MAG: glucosyl transferase [Ignavibacteriaceae bacterium]|jgi:hypothetical protein